MLDFRFGRHEAAAEQLRKIPNRPMLASSLNTITLFEL